MSGRLNVHNLLKEIAGNNNVYFQPPESLKLNYPAIVYSRSDIKVRTADDMVYTKTPIYKVVVIDFDPESTIVDNLSNLPNVRFVNHFTSDGLNHDVFTLYYDNKL